MSATLDGERLIGVEPVTAEDVAERFPRLRVALNGVSDTLFFPSGSSPERLMRQVRDEVRWKLT